ncbi:MAG TPA: hypothetical protein VMF91_21175 [Bryobacteraceae bacterium]|nr:hypothetical protein [Bryobacteraceae bacterium]
MDWVIVRLVKKMRNFLRLAGLLLIWLPFSYAQDACEQLGVDCHIERHPDSESCDADCRAERHREAQERDRQRAEYNA